MPIVKSSLAKDLILNGTYIDVFGQISLSIPRGVGIPHARFRANQVRLRFEGGDARRKHVTMKSEVTGAGLSKRDFSAQPKRDTRHGGANSRSRASNFIQHTTQAMRKSAD